MANKDILNIPILETTPVPISFNQVRFRDALAKTDSIISVFKAAIEAINYHLNMRFSEGDGIRNLIYERALLIDCILHYAWHQFVWSNKISLIAVGGYGRGELHPHSDIDLLILQTNSPQEKDAESIQNLLTLLWDIGLNVGHSVRTLAECTEIAKADLTVATNIIEARVLTGPSSLLKELHLATAHTKMWPNEQFFTAKIEEQRKRHEKYNDTEYNLEPNVKNAPGSLRDIQTIQWVAKRFFQCPNTLGSGWQRFFYRRRIRYATVW